MFILSTQSYILLLKTRILEHTTNGTKWKMLTRVDAN